MQGLAGDIVQLVCVCACVFPSLECKWHLGAIGMLWEPRGGEYHPALWVTVQVDRLGFELGLWYTARNFTGR